MSKSLAGLRSALFSSFVALIILSGAVAQAQPNLFKGRGRPANPGPHGAAANAVDVDADVLSAGPAQLWLDLPGRPAALASATDFETRANGGLVWRGDVPSFANSHVVLTRHKGLVVGTVWVDDETYEISPGPGQSHRITRLDPSSFPACEAGLAPQLSPASAQDTQGSSAKGPLAVAAADPNAEMHLLSMYTPQARDAAGSVAAIEATIQAAVDNANSSFINSDMIGRYVLVHTALANRNDSGNLSSDLNWLDSDAATASLRNLHGADMVSLIVENGGSGCGIGYVQRNPGSGFASAAFQVTDRGCAVGNLTFAHEHGHNIGMEHDPANGPLPSSASFPWSFGHHINSNLARTVMAYNCPSGCPRLMFHSNPDIFYQGFPTGVASSADNARTGDTTALIVHDFRPDANPATLSSIAVTPSSATVEIGQQQSYSSIGTYSDASTQDLTATAIWSSTNAAVATVSAGSATAVSAGSTGITASFDGVTSNSATLNVNPATLSSIAITPVASSIEVGQQQAYVAIGTYSDASTQDITAIATWSSTNNPVATITEGTATGVSAGSAGITASSEGVTSNSATLTVTSPATLSSIAITPVAASIDVGQQQGYSAIGTYSDLGTQDLTATATWSSTNAAVATVSAGTSTAVSPGSAGITAALDGVTSNSATLTVNPATLSSIAITPVASSIDIGQQQVYDAIGTYSDSSTQNLTATATWSSTNAAVATVSAGTATAVSAGSAGITAELDGVTSNSATLTVNSATLNSIAITPVATSIDIGQQQVYSAIGTYSDSSTQDLTATAAWSSANAAVATVSAGTATAVSAGSAGITAALDGVTSNSATLTVNPATLSSIAITPVATSIDIGQQQVYSAIGTYSDSSTQNLTATAAWSSANTAVATVSAGTATGVSAGSAGITAALDAVTSNSATLTVSAPAVLTSITVGPASATISSGSTRQFSATGNYDDFTTQDLTASATWASSNASVATINASGLASGSSAGTTNITASFDVVTSSPASLTVTVFDATGLAPNLIQAGVLTNVTVSGTGFVAGATLGFQNGSGPAPQATIISVSPSQILASFAVGTNGPKRNRTWDVIVQNGDGQTDVLPAALTVTLNAIPNNPPSVSIASPANGSSHALAALISFSGSANDVEDGGISANLSWTSNLDGAIGSGAGFSTSALSEGVHQITASVTDAGGLGGNSSISITVGNPNTAPNVSITSPGNGSSFLQGASVSFAGTATDNEDGNLAGSLSWSSNLDGGIGSGASFNTSGLSIGNHTITASVTDAGGLAGSDQITVTVTSNSPAVTVTSVNPASMAKGNSGTVVVNGSNFVSGASVSFENGGGPGPNVTGVVFVNSSQLNVAVSIPSNGPKRTVVWDVRVTNPDSSTGVGAGMFTTTR